MTFQKIFIALFTICLFQSCVIRISDDGSRDVKDPSAISAFDIKDFGKNKKYQSEADILFQEINGSNMVQINNQSKKTWIYLWGSWCKPCIEKLPSMIAIDKMNKDLDIILVSEDYAIAPLQKILFKNGYDKTPYLLESKSYGTSTIKKVKMLNQELCPECEFESGFPQNYLYQNTSMELYKIGALEDADFQKIGIKVK